MNKKLLTLIRSDDPGMWEIVKLSHENHHDIAEAIVDELIESMSCNKAYDFHIYSFKIRFPTYLGLEYPFAYYNASESKLVNYLWNVKEVRAKMISQNWNNSNSLSDYLKAYNDFLDYKTIFEFYRNKFCIEKMRIINLIISILKCKQP